MRQRLVSGLVIRDVFIATAAFTLTFLEVAEEVPHAKMTLRACWLPAESSGCSFNTSFSFTGAPHWNELCPA